MLIVGQNNEDTRSSYSKDVSGIMVYFPLFGLDGMDTTADFDNGETNCKQMLDELDPDVCNIGLYTRYMEEKIMYRNLPESNQVDYSLNRMKVFFESYPETHFILRIGYEPEFVYPLWFRETFMRVSEAMKDIDNVECCLHFQGSAGYDTIKQYMPNIKYVDSIGVSIFDLSIDSVDAVKKLADEHNLPVHIGETCCMDGDFESYEKELDKMVKKSGAKSVSYISSKWGDKKMWKNSIFKDVDSRIDDVKRNKLKNLIKE